MERGKGNLHLNDTAVCADIQHLSTELMGEVGNALQMLMLVSQRLRKNKLAWMEISTLANLVCLFSDR